MNVGRNTCALMLVIVLIGLSGLYTDFFLSLNAYVQNPHHFIEYEASQEIVHFFAYGKAPLGFFSLTIMFPLILSFLILLPEKHITFVYKKEYLLSILLFVIFIYITRVLAGLTWYLPTYCLVEPVQIASYLALGGIVTLLLIMIKEDIINESKNSC